MSRFLLKFFGFFGFLVAVIYLCDISYLFHGIRCTYLRGETSAQIDDNAFFHSRVVSAKSPFEIPFSKSFDQNELSDSLEHALKKSKSVAFLVVKNDSVLVERYWGGFSKESLTNSFSMAKSIVSLLVGCAIQDGYIENVDQSVFDFLPELSPFNGNDVTIRHLLEMSSGFDWLENYKRPISVTAKAYYGSNLKDLVLNRVFVSRPGKEYVYNSGNTQLLGVVLERAVGKSVSSFAGDFLWSKLGAKNDAKWTLDYKGGIEKTFCCFNSTARDFSKVGLMMLKKGVSVSGEKILSPEYVDWLLKVPFLKDGENVGETVDFYSNGWWIANVLEKRVFYARGFLGQYLVVIPDLNLVFVRLGKHENEKTDKNNNYNLTDNLLFFTKQVILEFS